MIRPVIFLTLLFAAGSLGKNEVVIQPLGALAEVGHVLQGVLSCGSQSKLLEVRVEDCLSLPCNVTAGRVYTSQIDFIPSESHEKLHVLLSVISLTSRRDLIILNEDILAPVEAGSKYTLQVRWSAPVGSPLGFIAPLLQVTGKTPRGEVMELCGLALSRVVA
ncbi:unnamed protein product [Allacma fusca]|uniref:Uncharacterized protein n=1 Tax=Allacma fusca TaxID=39272 RepID=A0A8J2KRE0_9HEXA|nr:unnamed protein product [Allacma fusca]